MSTVKKEGNNLHGSSPEVLEGERRTEHERWTSGFEPWSPEYERRVSMEVVTSGSMIEATAGFAAIVLSILSLVNILPMYLVPIATLVIGIGLLFEGGAVAFRYWRLPAEISAGRWASMELAGGMIAEFVAGITGVVLGILAILGFIPCTLVDRFRPGIRRCAGLGQRADFPPGEPGIRDRDRGIEAHVLPSQYVG